MKTFSVFILRQTCSIKVCHIGVVCLLAVMAKLKTRNCNQGYYPLPRELQPHHRNEAANLVRDDIKYIKF